MTISIYFLVFTAWACSCPDFYIIGLIARTLFKYINDKTERVDKMISRGTCEIKLRAFTVYYNML